MEAVSFLVRATAGFWPLWVGVGAFAILLARGPHSPKRTAALFITAWACAVGAELAWISLGGPVKSSAVVYDVVGLMVAVLIPLCLIVLASDHIVPTATRPRRTAALLAFGAVGLVGAPFFVLFAHCMSGDCL